MIHMAFPSGDSGRGYFEELGSVLLSIFRRQQGVGVSWRFTGILVLEVRVHIDALAEPPLETLLPDR